MSTKNDAGGGRRVPLPIAVLDLDITRRPLGDPGALALILRYLGEIAVIVSEAVPEPMVAAVARHAATHDESIIICARHACSRASSWLAAWREPAVARPGLRLVEAAS